MIYADASAILRIVFRERGPVCPVGRMPSWTSEVAEVETFRTVDRARLAGRLTDLQAARKNSELAGMLETLHRIPVSREIVDLARATFPVPVRALDALHVATAQWLQRQAGGAVEFWTHDERQATAALCRALRVMGAGT